MSDSMSDYLAQDMQCEDLLECFYGLNELDREVFGVLAASEAPITVDNIAEEVDRERSTAYRSVQRLLDAGFIRKERINYEHGGYYHVFEPVPAGKVADPLQRLLNDWYAEVGQLIDEFREKYEEPPPPPPGTEPARRATGSHLPDRWREQALVGAVVTFVRTELRRGANTAEPGTVAGAPRGRRPRSRGTGYPSRAACDRRRAN